MRFHPTLRFVLLMIAASVILFSLATWILEMAYQADRRGQAGGQLNAYLAREQPDVLVIGSSRAHHVVMPSVLSPGAYNLSHNGMNVVFQSGLVDVLAHKEALPRDLLLLQLQPEDLIIGSAADRHMQYLRYHHGRNAYITAVIDRLSWSEPLKYLAPAYRFNGTALTVLLNASRSRSETLQGDGFEPHPTGGAADSSKVILTMERAARHAPSEFSSLPDDPFTTPAGKALLHIRAICAAQGVRLVLFTSPYYSMPPIKKAVYAELIAGLRRAGFDYLDYSHDAIPTLAPITYWVDNDHLNADGAWLFSARLRDDLLHAGWLAQ